MKRRLVVLWTLAWVFALQAHPPKDILFTFDLNQKTVKLDIVHPVADPAGHFIYSIEVKINGKKAITQTARIQTSEASQSLVYVIPELKAEDIIEVVAECNKIGGLKKQAAVKP